MAVKKKTVHYRVDGCACQQGYVNIGDCDDNNVYDADGVPVPGAVITPAGDCPQEVVMVCDPNTPPPEPPPEPVPFDLEGVDCDGAPVTVSGLPGQLAAVVQAPGTVFKVQLCDNAKDYEKVILCDTDTDHKIAVITDFTNPNAPVVSYWDINTGAPWAGSLDDLAACPDIDTDSEAQTFCDAGTPFIRWFITKDGVPTGDYYDTDLTGAPYVPTDLAAVTPGECPAAACDPTISSAFGDDLSTLLPGNTIAIQKPSCCAIKVTTSAGEFLVRKGMMAYSTADFNCPVTVTGVEIVSGNCDVSEVVVTTQALG